uniref:DUF4440 domain-containing protein n=1 Tax=Rhabditophanes sp. KR3021 TaxID=114890 RepID=A0AC35TKR2_9BILA
MADSHTVLDCLSRSLQIVDKAHEQITERGKEMMEYMEGGNIEGLVEMYDKEAEILSSNVPICRGHDSLTIYYETLKKFNEFMKTRHPYEIHTLSPFLAMERGHCSWVSGGAKEIVKSRYFVLWIRRESGWMIMQDCRI